MCVHALDWKCVEMCTCESVCVCVKQDRSEMEGQLTRRWSRLVGGSEVDVGVGR